MDANICNDGIGPNSKIFDTFQPKDFQKNVSEVTEEKEIIIRSGLGINVEQSMSNSVEFKPNEVPKNRSWNFGSPLIQKRKKTLSVSKLISKLYIVINFILKLKAYAAIRKPKFLTDYHFHIINDKSFFPSHYKQQKLESRNSIINIIEVNRAKNHQKKNQSFFVHISQVIKSTIFRIMKFFPVVDPNKQSTIILDCIHITLIAIHFFIIPLQISLNIYLFQNLQTRNRNLYFFISKFTPLTLFLFFIIVDMHKAFYEKGTLVRDKEVIMKRYLKEFALKDILSIVFLILSVISGGFFEEYYNLRIANKILSLLFFLKITKFQKLMSEIEEYLFLDESSYNFFSLFSLLYQTMFIIHILACIWYSLADNDANTTKTWILEKGLSSENWLTVYIYSLYFVVITINTVGYGDISPTNTLETIFTVVLVYFACGFFAFIITSIGNIINDIARKSQKYKRQINIINGFMRKKNISFNLRKDVKKYLEHIWTEEISENQKEEEIIINSLSNSLKEKLLLEANGNLLKEAKYFCNTFSEDVLKKSVFILKEIRFIPGELIYMKDNAEDFSLYLIRKGEIGYFIESNSQSNPYNILYKLGRGQTFGEEEFFSQNTRKLGVVSTDYTTVLKLSLEDFKNILEQYPEDKEKYHWIKYQIQHNDNHSDIELKCQSCYKTDHSISNCPWIHRKICEPILIQKHLYSVDAKRFPFQRSKKLKMTLKKIKLIRKGALDAANHLDLYSLSSNSYLHESEEDEDNLVSDDALQSNRELNMNIGSNNRRSLSIENLNPAMIGYQRNINDSLSWESNENANLLHQNNEMVQETHTQLQIRSESEILHSNNQLQNEIYRKETLVETLPNNKTSLSSKINEKIIEFDKVELFQEYDPESNIDNVLQIYRLANGSQRFNRNKRKRCLKEISIKDNFSRSPNRSLIYEKDNFFHVRGSEQSRNLRKISSKIPSSTKLVIKLWQRIKLKIMLLKNIFEPRRRFKNIKLKLQKLRLNK